MFKKLTISTFAFLLSVLALSAQETWSLEQTVRYAQQNNLEVKRAQANISSSELSVKRNQANRIPTLNGNVNYGYNFGRQIDPTTNSFNTQSTGFNSLGLSTDVTVFSGGRIINGVKQSKYLLEASRLDASSTVNDLALDVATAYLNILLGEEQLANARQQLALSQAQLDQIDKLVRAGSRPENERFDLLAQIARNDQSIIEAQNTIDIGYLNLKQLMNVDQNQDIRIQRPEITIPADVNPDDFSINEIFTTALGSQPQIRANDFRLQGAQAGVDVAKGALLPSVSLFGNLDSRYSSQGRRVLNTQVVRIPQEVFIEDMPVTIFTDQVIPSFGNNSYFNQLNENFGQSFGVSLRVPILNNLSNRIGVQQARVDVLTTEVSGNLVRQQLKTSIQQAIANARAGKRSYEATQRSVEASQIAFDNAQRRFNLGAINTFELTTARNNLDLAQISFIQAKYQYFFNVKVVEFYQGKPIQLN